jgi:hypothetical protein
MKTPQTLAVLNFVYFTANFPIPFTQIIAQAFKDALLVLII